ICVRMDIEGENGGKQTMDIGAELLQRFQCLGTQDKDVLIREFQRFLPPNQLSSEGCAFFLDMNNWYFIVSFDSLYSCPRFAYPNACHCFVLIIAIRNLQQAICAYFDLDAPKDFGQNSLPSMTFVKDVTIGEGEEVPPNTRFIKTWRIQNSGVERWPIGCVLRFVAGDQMTTCERVIVDPLEPGHITDVSVEMISPSKAGIFQGQWRISTATGQYFGEVIWVIITVAEGGLLGLTQQMDSFHSLGSPVKSLNESMNPFASKSNQVPNFANYSAIRNEFNADKPGEHSFASVSLSTAGFRKKLQSTGLATDCEQSSAQVAQVPNSMSSMDTKTANNVNAVNGDPSDNHLPPTPPLSEDMML
ncbi:hypothetical protein B4U80_00683, partial [Leptotrombidium deliense]